MRVLVVGTGGREHALAWKMAESPLCESVFATPGNPGMKRDRIDIIPEGNILDICRQKKIDLVFVGPESPLVEGLIDRLESEGVACIGPSAYAAQLEGSKIFSKEFMTEFGIPTADFESFNDFESAKKGLAKWNIEEQGIVIKADGLAAGKGVVVTDVRQEAKETLENFMNNSSYGVQTKRILFEKKLFGREVSAFALCDGSDFLMLGYACDYKRLRSANQGPNTGGMGCFTPTQWPRPEHKKQIESIVEKVLKGMKERGHSYKGILFLGLMIDKDVNVIEFNVRFGDPETQTLIPLINVDLVELFNDVTKGNLKKWKGKSFLDERVSVHIVATSGGYPALDGRPMEVGFPISGEGQLSGAKLFYAGVKERDGILINSGGRVLGLTATGKDLSQAKELAYRNIKKIDFKHMHYRDDIGVIYGQD